MRDPQRNGERADHVHCFACCVRPLLAQAVFDFIDVQTQGNPKPGSYRLVNSFPRKVRVSTFGARSV